ncbi:hypothetical protein IFM89_015712 [Coptis chinensis]|uniref:Uncharacterized protein n=1 Tax=Coptis chinensis TaxID=261450 RepID=A0A835IBN1_9MAGN|nr:hypothetical protein IFM89_015712 [Coptis chinensis]
MRQLDLSSNQLNGTVPESLGQLIALAGFDLSNNLLEGVVYVLHLEKLSELELLFLSLNSLFEYYIPFRIPPFQLKAIGMSSCGVGPQFPEWLQTQKHLTTLIMSNASISDSIPSWFQNLSSTLSYIDLSSNQIHGEYCTSLSILDLSENSLFGKIPTWIGGELSSLKILRLRSNMLNGSIPPDIIDLARNNLSGIIPQCIGNFSGMLVVKQKFLRRRRIQGIHQQIESELTRLSGLIGLNLSENHLKGTTPEDRTDEDIIGFT